MNELYLGRMEYANGDWARIEPVAVFANGVWEPLTNRQRDFPEEGLVFVPPVIGLGSARAGGYWVFSREPNNRFTSGKDRYIVHQAASAIPLLDLSHMALEEARVTLFDRGVKLPNPVGEQVAVALANNLFCVLEFDVDISGISYARATSQPVHLMSLPSNWLRSGSVDEWRFVPLMSLPQVPSTRRLNWCGDAEFVERVLLRARKHFTQFGTQNALPGKETLQRIARALEQQELLTNGDDVELNLERLRSHWPRLMAHFKAAEEMRNLVLESDVAIELVEEARKEAADLEVERVRPIVEAQVREGLRSEIEEAEQSLRRIGSDLHGATAKLTEVTSELQRLSLERNEVAASASNAKRELEIATAAFGKQLEQVSPQEVPFARAFLARLRAAMDGRSLPRLPESSPPWVAPTGDHVAPTITFAELQASLQRHATAHGLASLDEVDAFARAGEVVLLTGICAERSLRAYSDCVSGGQTRNVVLDPSVIGLDDLWATPAGKLPTGLAMAWTYAETHSDATVVICLRAVDASPMHLWLPPLAQVLRSSFRPSNLLVFALPLGGPLAVYRQDYPGHEHLLRWLVPVKPSQSAEGGLSALGSLSDHAPRKTILRWEATGPDLAIQSPEFVSRVVNLDGDAVLRAARVAGVTLGRTAGQRLFADWVALLNSNSEVRQCAGLGIDELRGLNYQG